MAALKLIAVGNPGAGKSSFGNCLLGRAEFYAAPSDTGGGVTTEKKEGSSDKYRYVDVPGLADPDPKLREAAARAVTDGLKEDVNTKILFFVRTVQGRILAEDKVLMTRVAEALGDNLQENKYGVIVNQFKKKAYDTVMKDELKKREWLAKLWVGMKIHGEDMPRTDHVAFNPEDDEMDGEENKVKSLPGHILNFVDVFPLVKIRSALVKQVDTKNFDSAVEKQAEVDKSWQNILDTIVVPLAGALVEEFVAARAASAVGPAVRAAVRGCLQAASGEAVNAVARGLQGCDGSKVSVRVGGIPEGWGVNIYAYNSGDKLHITEFQHEFLTCGEKQINVGQKPGAEICIVLYDDDQSKKKCLTGDHICRGGDVLVISYGEPWNNRWNVDHHRDGKVWYHRQSES